MITVNLLFIAVFVYMIFDNIKLFKSFTEAKNYVQLHSVSEHKIASSDMQDNFDELISESGLTINNKNVEYSPFEEQSSVIKGSYKLAAKGKYLPFINYLELLQKKNMLYKVNSLSLKVKSLEEITIKLDIESLYEIK